MAFRRLGRLALGIVALMLMPAGALAGATAHLDKVGPSPAGRSLDLVLPLAADLPGLRGTALAVTTPGSPEYGAYRSIGTLSLRFGASPATRRRVTAYLCSAGARAVGIDPTGLFADATMPVDAAQRLFATPLAAFRAGRGGRFIAPANLAAAASAGSAARIPPGCGALSPE